MRILIVDDHELVRSGVRSVLAGRRDFNVCGEAVDGQDAVEKARLLNPDVIVMDVSMPKLNGLDATREIQRILPQTAVLVLSQHDSPEMMRQALNAGARGYVVKSAIAANLVTGIEKVRGGELFFDASAVKLPQATGDKHLDVKEILRRSEAFEEALRESEERFRLTFEHAAVGIAHVAPDGRWIRVNRKLSEILGYTQEEVQKLTFQELTYPADLPGDLAELRRLVSGESDQYLMEKRYIRKNGQLVWAKLTVAAVRESAGAVKYFVSIVEDISAQKDAEARLLASEDRLRALLEFQTAAMSNMAEGLYTLDENGLATSINPAGETMLGWTSAELLGKNMHDLIHFKRLDGTRYGVDECPLLQLLHGGATVREREDLLIRKDGSFMPVIYSASPIRQNGKVVGIVSGFRDGSEQHLFHSAMLESERRLRAMAENLEAEVRARTAELELRNAEVSEQSELLRDLSVRLLQAQDDERRRIARELHDSVGQILTVLGLNVGSLAMRSPALPPDAAKTVEQSERLLDQLNREIRTMSYLLHPPLLDESGLDEALRWYIGGLRQRSNIGIDLEVPPEFGRLSSEAEMMVFRIVQEALTNIHRHSRSEMALIRLTRDDESVSLEIQDWGTGIPPERLKAIQSHGSGVGIRGMRERVRQLHGELKIESGADGTRVCVTFPASGVVNNERSSRQTYLAN
ncbi:MAG: PAS domain S-box protein [Candidatus Acidiferrales bacterium]